MQGHGPIRLYYTMCDDDWSDDVIVKKHQEYHQFVWLHYDKSIRRVNWYKRNHITYLDIVQIIREKVIPPTRDELFPPPPSPLPLAME
jgi:hypothetical protein